MVVVEGGGGEEARRDPDEEEDRRRKKEEMRLKLKQSEISQKSLLPCRREHGKFTQKYSLKIEKKF